MTITDKMNLIIETETIKLNILKEKDPINKYQIAKQQSYLQGVIETWEMIKIWLETNE